MRPASDAAGEVRRDPISDSVPAGRCSNHPERRASITCPYCGSYACGDCTVDTLWGDVMCEECKRHGRAQYPLPWERRATPVSFLQTVYLLFAEAAPCFSDLPRGRVLRAVGFALAVSLSLVVGQVLGDWLFAPRHWAVDSPGPLGVLGGAAIAHLPSTALFILVVALTFHATATLLGGRTAFATSFRAACYLTVIQLLELVVLLVDTVLLRNSTPVTLIVRLVGLFFLVWGLSLLAEHRFQLSKPRAIAAGLAPAVLFVAGALGLVFLVY